MRKLPIGQKVHVDTDHPDWGRVAGDGTIVNHVKGNLYLVNVESIRADILVKRKDMWVR